MTRAGGGRFRKMWFGSSCRLTAALGGLLLFVTLGCSEEQAPPRPRGLLDAYGRPVEGRQHVAKPEPKTQEVGKAPAPAQPPAALPSPFAGDEEEAEAAAEEEEEAPKRDLSQELSVALGEPTACLDVERAGALGGANIRFTAVVLATGRVSRATVTATGQPASALRCIEERVAGLRLEPPIEDAPVTVQGQTQVKVVRVSPGDTPGASVRSPTTNFPPPNPDIEYARPPEDVEFAGSPDR